MHLNDITDAFDFINDRLVYVDAPLEGILRSKTGELYAFRVLEIIKGSLRHWVLIPITDEGTDLNEAFDTARSRGVRSWRSIVEDSRSGSNQLTMCELPIEQLP